MTSNKQGKGIGLKKYRKLAGLTLRQVEAATGISNPYLSQLENNKIKNPSVNTMYKLAKLYNVEFLKFLIDLGMVEAQVPAPFKSFKDIVFKD